MFEQYECCWQLFSFGTERYQQVLAQFKPKLELMWRFILENGGHRVECKSHINHVTVHALLRIIDFTHEATLKQYGTDGADYYQFAKVWPKQKPRVTGEANAGQRGTPTSGVKDDWAATVIQ